MAILGDEDLAVMIADLAAMGGTVAVTFDGTTVDGLEDRAAIEMFGAIGSSVIATDNVVWITHNDLPTLANGDTITVDGVAKNVHKIMPEGDGAMRGLVIGDAA